jgi:hypothetical protein
MSLTPSVPRYTLIRGDFYILYPDLPQNGPQPDGDTINFLPDHEDLVLALKRFSNRRAERKHLGTYSVRFEGIDALETHFEGRHQRLDLANAARDTMLSNMGFGEVTYWPGRPNNVKTAANHPIRGYLLANGIESNGRVLGFVYPGERGGNDGDRVHVGTADFDASLNGQLLVAGLAYAELYHTMPIELIRHAQGLIAAARGSAAGLWPEEDVAVGTSAQIAGLSDLPELVMFPKLYRRLVKYFSDGHSGLGNFDTWIRADPVKRDDTLLMPTGELGNLHDLYDIDAAGIKLRFNPEAVIFNPDPPT